MMFGSGSGAGSAEHPGGAASANEGSSTATDARVFLRGAQTHTTFRLHLHRQHAELEYRHHRHGRWCWSSGARDRSTTMRVNNDSAGATPPPFFRSRVRSRAAKASAIGGRLPTLFLSFQTPGTRLCAAIATPPKSRSPGLHLELLCDPSSKTRFPSSFSHVPLQRFLGFNAMETPRVSGSGRNWVGTLRAGSYGYSASFLAVRDPTCSASA
jgi:hypothetical protein